TYAACVWAANARTSYTRTIALCQALHSTGRPRGATSTPSGMVLLSVAVAIVTRAGPPARAAPPAAPRATTPNPATDISDVLNQAGSVDRFGDTSRHCNRHGIG